MGTFRAAVRRYPLVAATLAVALIGLILLATPARPVAAWFVGGFALAVALWEAIGMIRSLLRGHAGLDILAVTAITAAVLVGEPWAALVVVLMLTGGAALEDYAENRSKRELTALLARVPQRATRLLPAGAGVGAGADAGAGAGTEAGAGVEAAAGAGAAPAARPALAVDGGLPERTEQVPVDEIRVGDELLVRPGELVPVDAVLLHEAASFDESSLTGESLPVERAAGERVSSGVVCGSAAVRLRAVAPAADSEYQRIVRLVEEAAGSRSRVVRLADRYAVPFTLLSLAIAGAAWLISGDPVRFAEVLVVATPCPLLIAAPVAFLGGMSRAARFGLIVKGGGTLEQLSRVRAIAFDKTGTLTSGRPELVRVDAAEGFDESEVLQLAAAAEVYSSHVLAASVVLAAKARGLALLPVESAEEHQTEGVSAVLGGAGGAGGVGGAGGAGGGGGVGGAGGDTVRVGKPGWVRGFAPGQRRVELEAGELAIYVARGDRYAGALVMRDRVREEAGDALAELRALGIDRMLMVTGDVAATAGPIAAGLGIGEVHAESRPEDKVRIVAAVDVRPLLFAGDGLNDAPVLAAADVGFAMGARGSTAASESADVVNRFDNLRALPRAVRIGRDTVRIALQSIWLGIAISVGLMLVAAYGFLPALLGAWLQEIVDLVAILGALRAVGPRSERRPAPAR